MSKHILTRTNRKEIHRLLNDSDTHALTVLLIVLSRYEDYFQVDPLEIYARLQEDFHVKLPDALENRLQALTVAMTTNSFETDPSAYDSIVKALVDGDPDLEHGDPDITADEMLWAEYEVRVAKDEPLNFSPAVEGLRMVLMHNENSEQEVSDIAETLEAQRAKLLKDLQDAGFDVSRVPEL